MPKVEDGIKNARKILPIIYVIDTSGSMAGTRIAAVNQAMAETTEVLKEVSAKNPSAEFKIGVLQFASGASWVTDGLESIGDFHWNDLIAGGTADLGAALDELNINLSRIAILNSEVGYKVPVLIFMMDGSPTDDYKSALKKISNNNGWFNISTKICIAIDEDSDVKVLQEIAACGDKAEGSESVIQITDMDMALLKLIKVVPIYQWANMSRILIKALSRDVGDTGGDPFPGESETTHVPDSEPVPDDPCVS